MSKPSLVDAVLGKDGLFAKKMPAFHPRQAQLSMARAVEQSIHAASTVLAESGTGTGKTFAYLIPAIQSDKKTIISTGTKHLQEQLFHRDIPSAVKIMGANCRVSLLKGRANYLCLYRYQLNKNGNDTLGRQQKAQIESLNQWLSITKSGDIAEQNTVPEDAVIWPALTSTVENCLGQECHFFEECYVNRARKQAMQSDIVVINHHLFFADKVLKQDGFGELLPEAKTYIFDEAHQLLDTASHFLGKKWGAWQIVELARDVKLSEVQQRSLVADLGEKAEALEKMLADYRLSFGVRENRIAWQDFVLQNPNVMQKMEHIIRELAEFKDLLEIAAPRSESFTRCYERAVDLLELSQAVLSKEVQANVVRWVELTAKSFRVHETPIEIGEELQHYFSEKDKSVIFTSATLSVNRDFHHFRSNAGLGDDCVEHSWDSPFNYFEQAVMYVPEHIASIKEEDFAQSMFDAVLPLIRSAKGRAFLLFTSFRVMAEVERHLKAVGEFSVWVQGEQNKRELLRNFIDTDHSVLLGTMSFWEGVDVPGEALTVVVIDKLPFESPFDPVLKARLEAMKKNGQAPFYQYQIPRAVITLRQGVGRLIRSQSDKGVLMVCDTRLTNASYGATFLNSLPRMRRTRDEAKVCRFLESIHRENKPCLN